jgi:hypothetical protein
LKKERITCSSKVAKNTLKMLDEIQEWSGMTKGQIVDLAISDLHMKKKTDKSLMVYIHKEEDRAFILDAISKEYADAYEKVLETIEQSHSKNSVNQ